MSASIRLRAALFVAASAYFLLGPLAKQVGGLDWGWLRSWRMYSRAFPVCKVSYVLRDDGGAEHSVDRFATLGADPRTAPTWLRRVEDADGVVRVGEALCARLGDGVDLRARAACSATDDAAWVTEMAGERNLCAEPPR